MSAVFQTLSLFVMSEVLDQTEGSPLDAERHRKSIHLRHSGLKQWSHDAFGYREISIDIKNGAMGNLSNSLERCSHCYRKDSKKTEQTRSVMPDDCKM